MSAKTRAEILDSAKKCVCEDRNGQYGEPEDSFKNIADYWTTYIRHNFMSGADVCIRPVDVAMMMALFKIARIETADNAITDSYVDAIGYIACGGDIALEREKVMKEVFIEPEVTYKCSGDGRFEDAE